MFADESRHIYSITHELPLRPRNRKSLDFETVQKLLQEQLHAAQTTGWTRDMGIILVQVTVNEQEGFIRFEAAPTRRWEGQRYCVVPGLWSRGVAWLRAKADAVGYAIWGPDR